MRRLVVPALTAILMAACSATPPASTTPDAVSAAPSPSATTEPSDSPSPDPTPTPTPTLAPTSSPTSTPVAQLPEVGPAPDGPWTSIHWLKAGDLGLTASPDSGHDLGVLSWSGGYVALDQSPGSDADGNELPVTIQTSASADGVHWAKPTTLETGFKGMFHISRLVEGPNGLLALAYPFGDTCGGPESVYAMWSSPDGRTWTRLALPKTFSANRVEMISGGKAGYIAFGTKGDTSTPMIWTSPDARAWTVRPLPTVSSGTLVLDQVASFDDGFVILGGVLGEDGCGGKQHIKPAVWFSSTGASWTRSSLPGASTDPNASLAMRSSGNRLLVIQYLPGDLPTSPAWTSTDGKTFTSVGKISSDVRWDGAIVDGHSITAIGPDSGTGPTVMLSVDSLGAMLPLTQSGDVPLLSEDGPQLGFVVGPTGVLAYTEDGIEAWIGVPS